MGTQKVRAPTKGVDMMKIVLGLILLCCSFSYADYSRGGGRRYGGGHSSNGSGNSSQVRVSELIQVIDTCERYNELYDIAACYKDELNYLIDTARSTRPSPYPGRPNSYRCAHVNTYGKYAEGGGCNVYGCYYPGGGCNVYGCYDSGGACNVYGCYERNGSCNVYGCINQTHNKSSRTCF